MTSGELSFFSGKRDWQVPKPSTQPPPSWVLRKSQSLSLEPKERWLALGGLALTEPEPEPIRSPLRLRGTARETHSPCHADAFLDYRPPSLAASLSVSLSMLRLCVSVPTLSWPLLCLSLPVRQPICLSWPPPHPTQSTGHREG